MFVLILSTWNFGFIIFLSVIQRIIIILSPIQRIIIFSKSNSAHHYFSKSNSAHHYLISSKCKQALIFISKCKPALIFVLLGMKQCPIVVPKQFHISLLFLGLFDYVSNATSNYVQNF